MLDDVYNAKILGFAGNIQRIGRLDAPDATAKAHSKLCGSTVVVDLRMDGDTVVDFAHEVKACALGQASSSIMLLMLSAPSLVNCGGFGSRCTPCSRRRAHRRTGVSMI